jgi:hypothetical protein
MARHELRAASRHFTGLLVVATAVCAFVAPYLTPSISIEFMGKRRRLPGPTAPVAGRWFDDYSLSRK